MEKPKLRSEIYSDVASCAFQRWAAFDGSTEKDDKRRAQDEKKTAFMALAMAHVAPRPYSP